MTSGIFITFEGGDGVGKTTQIDLLCARLQEMGRDVVVTREPGGTPLGQELRELVLHSRQDIAPRAEALLYAADRAHNVETVVKPALAAGTIVIQDRYLDSSIAYQGAGRGLGIDEIRRISLWAAGGLLPDITVLLDVDAAHAKQRLASADKPFDRFESQAQEFHERVRLAFLDLAAAEPDRFFVVDASREVDAIAQDIFDHVSGLLGIVST